MIERSWLKRKRSSVVAVEEMVKDLLEDRLESSRKG